MIPEVAPLATPAAIGTVLPLLVALITRPRAEPATRGVTLLLLSVATAVISTLVDRLATTELAPVDWSSVVTAAIATWVTGQTAHTGLWRRTRLARRLRAIDPGPRGGRHRGPETPDPHPPVRLITQQEDHMAVDFTDLLDQGDKLTTNAAAAVRSLIDRAHELADDVTDTVTAELLELIDKARPVAEQLDAAFGNPDAPVPAGPLPADRVLDEGEAAQAVGVTA